MSSVNIENRIKEIIFDNAEQITKTLTELFVQFKKEMETEINEIKKDLENKEEIIKRLEKETRKKDIEIKNKEEKILQLKKEKGEYEKEIRELKAELATASNLVIEKDNQISNLEKEKDKLKNELKESNAVLNKITSQLKEVSKQYQDLSKQKNQQLDTLRLLDVYIVLLEKVFNSAPHVRILFVAHGEKKEWTIQELAKATGIEPLAVRRAIFELRNAGLFSYDENTGKARLLVRLWK